MVHRATFIGWKFDAPEHTDAPSVQPRVIKNSSAPVSLRLPPAPATRKTVPGCPCQGLTSAVSLSSCREL